MDNISHFIVRVYALIINQNGQVLLSDEFVMGQRMTKFPGGGLKFGEGTLECLRRESIEEFGQPVEVIGHFYTTDFFQKALFYPNHQLLGIYYMAMFKEPIRFPVAERAFAYPAEVEGSQSFRWRVIDPSIADELTFPIDKVVAGKLNAK